MFTVSEICGDYLNRRIAEDAKHEPSDSQVQMLEEIARKGY